MSRENAVYLGDGVYAEATRHGDIRLTTKTNEIFLDMRVMDSLVLFAKNLWKPLEVIAHHELKREWEK